MRSLTPSHFLSLINAPLVFYLALLAAYASAFYAAAPQLHPLHWVLGSSDSADGSRAAVTVGAVFASVAIHLLVAVVLRAYRRCAAWDAGYLDEAWYVFLTSQKQGFDIAIRIIPRFK
mgnify:CR=1 FL=1